MPIQFTCDSCRGVLSIARRKAYALIDCPKCGSKQVVPNESRSLKRSNTLAPVAVGTAQQATAPSATPVNELPLFERFDFENLLANGTKPVRDVTAETKAAPALEVEPVPVAVIATPIPDAPAGVELIVQKDRIVLRRIHLYLAGVLVLTLFGLAFGLGFMVARLK